MPPVFTFYEKFKKEIKHLSLLLILLVVLQIIFNLISAFFYRSMRWMNIYAYEGVAFFLITILSTGFVLLLGKKIMPIPWKKEQFQWDFSLKDIFQTVCMMVGISLTFSIFLNIIQMILGISLTESVLGQSNDALYVLYSLLTAIVIAPVLEELFFRGFLLQRLRSYDLKFAIVFSGLCFGLMHMNFMQGSMHIFTGILLAAVCIKYESILFPIVCHMLYNTVMCLGSYLTNSIVLTILSVLLWVMAIYGWVCLVRKIPKNMDMDPIYLKFACKQVGMIVFFVLFVIFSILSISF